LLESKRGRLPPIACILPAGVIVPLRELRVSATHVTESFIVVMYLRRKCFAAKCPVTFSLFAHCMTNDIDSQKRVVFPSAVMALIQVDGEIRRQKSTTRALPVVGGTYNEQISMIVVVVNSSYTICKFKGFS
jgi:hypothetical protein